MAVLDRIRGLSIGLLLVSAGCSSSSNRGASDAGVAGSIANGGNAQAGEASGGTAGIADAGGDSGGHPNGGGSGGSSSGSGGTGGSGEDSGSGEDGGSPAGTGGQSNAGGVAGQGGSGGVSGNAGNGGSGGAEAGSGFGWSGQDHPPAPIDECSCNIPVDGNDAQRCVKVVNRCNQGIRFHAAGNDVPANAFAGTSDLAPGACKAFELTQFASGRLWAETGCDGGQCDPGPHTLAEFTLNGYQGLDFYDLSLVDGFNLTMSIRPVAGTFTPSAQKYNCGAPICVYDLLTDCPTELQKKDGQGNTVVCQSACSALHEDQYCCAGAHDTPQTCPATDLSNVFKAACPDAYSYAYDDKASTYTCAGAGLAPDYDIVFCP